MQYYISCPASLGPCNRPAATYHFTDIRCILPHHRFPSVQADMASSCDHISRVRAALPYDPAVPVSAATERWLCAQRRAGRLSYADGGTDVEALEGGCRR